jgi:hypothetical protein
MRQLGRFHTSRELQRRYYGGVWYIVRRDSDSRTDVVWTGIRQAGTRGNAGLKVTCVTRSAREDSELAAMLRACAEELAAKERQLAADYNPNGR